VTYLDDMFTEAPLPPSRNRGAVGKRLSGVLILGLIVAMVVIAWRLVAGDSAPTDYPGPGSGEVTVVVSRGATLTEIGQVLEESGVVLTAEAFVEATMADERSSSLGPGAYSLLREMRAADALALMLSPQSREENRLILPEGLRMSQTFEIAAEVTGLPVKDFEAVAEDPTNVGLPEWAEGRLEGFLFPASYDLAGDEDARQVVRTLVGRFDQAAATTDLASRAREMGRDPYEILIIASLIEAEVLPNDFAKAAAVVYNRLELGMPLQFDSTVSYALGITELLLSKEQLATDSPYNTYEVTGLPPTPINSPGEAAIEAALAPAKAKWLYFVTVDPTTRETKFARSYERFLKLKRQFQQNVADQ
jgi:UPF0755 protein